MSLTEFREKHSWWVPALLIIVFGLGMIIAGHRLSGIHWIADFMRAAGDAIVIAGILALVVDRPLKRRLLAEAARGIFKHMLGFDQQPEIKERLERIALETTLFTRQRNIHVKIEPTETGQVTVTARVEVDLVNPSPTVKVWQQYMTFERGENATMLGMGLLCSDSSQNYWSEEPLKPLNDGWVLEVRAPQFNVRPNLQYRLISKYRLLLPDDFYFKSHSALPSIGFQVSVDCPETFEINVTPCSGRTNMVWMYDGLLMPAEPLHVRWRRTALNHTSISNA